MKIRDYSPVSLLEWSETTTIIYGESETRHVVCRNGSALALLGSAANLLDLAKIQTREINKGQLFSDRIHSAMIAERRAISARATATSIAALVAMRAGFLS